MTPTTTISPPDTPAQWAPHCLDAWRRLAELRDERDAYRILAQQAIHALADLTTRHRRQTARYHALLDERRRIRPIAPREAA